MSANSSTSSSLPFAVSWYVDEVGSASGSAPTWPATICKFCLLIADATVSGVIPIAVIFCGSNQTRIAYSFKPKIVMLPTPGTRLSSSYK